MLLKLFSEVCVCVYIYIHIHTVCNYCNIQVVLLYYYYILYYILFALLVTKAKLKTLLLNLLSTSVYINIPLT